MVNEFSDKLSALERTLSTEHGGFHLFCAHCAQRGEGVYELVVSAPWLSATSKDDVALSVSRTKDALTDHEWVQLASVVVLDPTNHVVAAINQAISMEHPIGMSFTNTPINTAIADTKVEHLMIITSSSVATPKA